MRYGDEADCSPRPSPTIAQVVVQIGEQANHSCQPLLRVTDQADSYSGLLFETCSCSPTYLHSIAIPVIIHAPQPQGARCQLRYSSISAKDACGITQTGVQSCQHMQLHCLTMHRLDMSHGTERSPAYTWDDAPNMCNPGLENYSKPHTPLLS
ncbi:hypothetical protein T440DRAFT_170092 [Plenodomus tracheiphilus IPT5]|uniref:Uncharacterized protein n=1 Tax=Plenodomus tracheiphilus IPT5 TaxID=1408161 RepID=A0A6A7B211_9PLEO|nr:hypothetical protein T440DRAFT_170092 [Plenodomus tracheiphilus IPT5]